MGAVLGHLVHGDNLVAALGACKVGRHVDKGDVSLGRGRRGRHLQVRELLGGQRLGPHRDALSKELMGRRIVTTTSVSWIYVIEVRAGNTAALALMTWNVVIPAWLMVLGLGRRRILRWRSETKRSLRNMQL